MPGGRIRVKPAGRAPRLKVKLSRVTGIRQITTGSAGFMQLASRAVG